MGNEQDKMTLMKAAAGRRYMAFLTIYNSGNTERLRTFIEDNTTDKLLEKSSVDGLLAQYMAMKEATGKLKVHQVVAADDYYIVVLVMAQTDGKLYINEYKVDEDYPHKVLKYNHHLADESKEAQD